MTRTGRPLIVALAAGLIGLGPAYAQLQLPGAVQGGGSPGGGSQSYAPLGQGGEAKAARTAGVPVRAPTEASLIDRDLRQNGANGLIRFERRNGNLVITRLVLGGERIANRRETCQIEVEGGPFAATPKGRDKGLKRFSIGVPACPFSFVVLDAAILASVDEGAPALPEASARPDNTAGATAGMCAFKQADCVVHIRGVWGPSASAIPASEIQQIIRMRSAAEKNALANYRALVAQAGRDRKKVREIAAEQASFSSKRSEQCFDYDREEVHGFCSSRITEAHAVALRAQLNPSAFEAENSGPDRSAAPARARPQPVRPSGPAPGAPLSLGGAR